MNLYNKSEKFFWAAFFFLPLSKPLMFVALFVACALFAGGGGLARARQSWRTLPWTIPAAILAILPALSLLIHSAPQSNLEHLNLAYFWLIALIVFCASSQMPVLPWVRSFLLGVGVLFVYAQLERHGWLRLRSAPAGYGNYILYSQFLALALALLAILYRQTARRDARLGCLVAMTLLFLELATSQSRTGMLAILLLLPFIFHKIFGAKNYGKVLAACLVAGALLAASPVVQQRARTALSDLQKLEQNVSETSLGYRVAMWRTGLDVLRAHPLLGGGFAAFQAEWNKVPRAADARAFVEPHNAFVFFAAAYGLVGLAALVWLYAALLWTGWRARASHAGGITLAFAVICVTGSFTNTMFTGAASRALIMLFIGLQGALLYAPPPARTEPA